MVEVRVSQRFNLILQLAGDPNATALLDAVQYSICSGPRSMSCKVTRVSQKSSSAPGYRLETFDVRRELDGSDWLCIVNANETKLQADVLQSMQAVVHQANKVLDSVQAKVSAVDEGVNIHEVYPSLLTSRCARHMLQSGEHV